MSSDLIIKSYPGDYQWLAYALRSIAKFCTGFGEIIVIVPFGVPPPTGVLERVCCVQERGDGYLWQQAIKLNADSFSGADVIFCIDSDTIFTGPFSPEDYMLNGKVKWFYTPYEHMNGTDGYGWRSTTEKFIGEPVEHEFMRRPPQCFYRRHLAPLRQFCWNQHGINLESYVLEAYQRQFSEWNALGAFLWKHPRYEYAWIDTTTAEPLEPQVVLQSWSWGGLTDEAKDKIESILA